MRYTFEEEFRLDHPETVGETDSLNNYKDLKKTKVFEDNATLLEIKQWAKEAMNAKKVEVEDISLGCLDFSDVDA